jgi:hypothetical protein
MSNQTLPAAPMPHLDVPEIPEVYVDFVRQLNHAGPMVKIEFAVTRFDKQKPGVPQTGRSRTAARMVMPLESFLQFHATAATLIAQLEANGLKINPVHQVPTQPKH